MKTVSLKIDDVIFNETEQVLAKIKKPRNRYINDALDFYNKLHKRNALAEKLQRESHLVAKDSLKILNEFEKLDEDNKAV